MSAFRRFFKRLTGAREGGTSAAAVETKVKVEYDVSSSHPRHVIKFFIHPEDEESVKKMMAVKRPGFMDFLSNINLIAGSGDLFWKSGRTLFKAAKASSLKEVLKGEGCCFSQQSERHLASLVLQSRENTARLEYLEQVADHYAKYGLTKGSPPPPVRPLPPSKQEPNGNNGKGKGNGNGKGKGQGKGDGDGDGDGDGNVNGNGNGKSKGNGNGNGHGNGNGGAPALSENDTLPEPFDLPF